MSISYDDIIQAITVDRHSVVCIDDGGSPHHKLGAEFLVQGFHLFVAIVCSPESYIELTAAHEDWKKKAAERLGISRDPELHAADLNIPKSNSTWKGVDSEVRANLMREAADKFLPHVDKVAYGYIGKDQHLEIMSHPGVQSAVESQGDLAERFKDVKKGLELTFYKALSNLLAQSTAETFIVMQDAGRIAPENIETIFQPHVNIWESSVIHLDSEVIAGIQVADLISWSLNREAFTKSRISQGDDPTPFGMIANEVRKAVKPKLIHLFDVPDDSAASV
ncbi:hypothetical protein ENSA5_15240 [Enhygromyxa salina]|uniref:DUF3800 domain-containing protein n=1 Tax=Enhygromyxa salina TaxID=215803 RepID=A0A2S9YEE5_9BACT|nr:DUF3800 domain-containing protein [Enhygromyxa salina]PRQ03494.1 hypothetical protein ENSA5_15240 [Enhygromyxa salina]